MLFVKKDCKFAGNEIQIELTKPLELKISFFYLMVDTANNLKWTRIQLKTLLQLQING